MAGQWVDIKATDGGYGFGCSRPKNCFEKSKLALSAAISCGMEPW